MRSAALLLLVASPALAQPAQSTGDVAGDIAATPVRDTNLKAKDIPPILQRAAEDPYARAGLPSCAIISREIADLNEALGPDFDSEAEDTGSKRGRVAEGVARGVIEGLIPFRGIVREVTGAADAQRRSEAAIDAGIARRGFLRGTARARGCRR